MRLLLVRHAETALAGRFCGWSDPPLNERGLAQVERLLERLAGECTGLVYTSDLRRARETAEAIGRASGASVRVCAGLREINFGEWEGLAWEEIEGRDKEYAERWMAEFPALPAPGGERFSEFRERVLREFAEIQRQSIAAAEGTVAVVTHAGVLGLLLEESGGCSAHEAWLRTRDYTGVIECTVDLPEGALTITS